MEFVGKLKINIMTRLMYILRRAVLVAFLLIVSKVPGNELLKGI